MALNIDKLMAYRPADIAVHYTREDSIFYALSIGLGMDPVDAGQLRFVCGPELQAFPAMASVLGWMGRLTDPAFGIDARKVVASDLRVELHAPLAPAGDLVSRPRIRDVIDRGAGGAAIIRFERELFDGAGRRVATIQHATLAREHGGFGGEITRLPEAHALPEGDPDLVCDLPTPPNLALLFSLNGDTNPIHTDPASARAAGFARPLLHGAATWGVAAHALIKSVAGYRAERFASMEARFARPMFPGETLRTQAWVRGNQVSFRCLAMERGECVLDKGLLQLHPAP